MLYYTVWTAGCSEQMDVVFILDISGSVQEKYDNALMFAGNVTYGLDIDSGNVRVGAVAYSSTTLSQFYLRDYNRRDAVLQALRFYNPGGSTNTASALDEVRNTHFTASYGARSGVRKVNRPSTAVLVLQTVLCSQLYGLKMTYLLTAITNLLYVYEFSAVAKLTSQLSWYFIIVV